MIHLKRMALGGFTLGVLILAAQGISWILILVTAGLTVIYGRPVNMPNAPLAYPVTLVLFSLEVCYITGYGMYGAMIEKSS